jgi:hypothetical protein
LPFQATMQPILPAGTTFSHQSTNLAQTTTMDWAFLILSQWWVRPLIASACELQCLALMWGGGLTYMLNGFPNLELVV